MNVFELRRRVTADYARYMASFVKIRDPRMKAYVDESLENGLLWPDPLIQLNPAFEPGAWIKDLVAAGTLHGECARIFRARKRAGEVGEACGSDMRLHRHQLDAVLAAQTGENYVLTTGTGSGKSLSYIVPIVDHVLRHKAKYGGKSAGVQAIVVYPMNALANSQEGELRKFVEHGYASGDHRVTFARYTGQETQEERERIQDEPPDIILTNYVMLELMLTRVREQKLIKAAEKSLRFLVLDELHTYRGRQGADVALLVRRVRERLAGDAFQCVGTSATIAGAGTQDEQRAEVARVASRLFGAEVKPANVIGETLRRLTPQRDVADPTFAAALTARVADASAAMPTAYEAFAADPLASWIESTFGVVPDGTTGRLVRAKPMSVSGEEGAAAALGKLTGLDEARCERAITDGLLAGFACKDPETNAPAFAFRLHQFVSRGESVFASLEDRDTRHFTTQGQQFVPGSNKTKVLIPVAFCRECGQEYYTVRKAKEEGTGKRRFIGRGLSDTFGDKAGEPGFLYISADKPWPTVTDDVLKRVPADWLEDVNGTTRIKYSMRDYIPQAVRVNADGTEAGAAAGVSASYVDAPFRFCLQCGVSYGGRQGDFGKLTGLGTGGRSSATTLLSLSAIRFLRSAEAALDAKARKLLSFTDNRQDASLQAGHFNDMVEIGLLRGALYRAVADADDEGIAHDEIAKRVVKALGLPFESYASDPELRPYAQADTKRALENVIAYRIYRDLKRGWRITMPNLEGVGLLEIRYPTLDDMAADTELWQQAHPALVAASPATRARVAKVLLDFMRRELAVHVDYLDDDFWTKIQQQSSQHLRAPWAIDENETQESATILFPRSERPSDRGMRNLGVFLSGRSGFGQFLRRSTTFPGYTQGKTRINLAETQTLITDLLTALRKAGLVEQVRDPKDADDVPGYQLKAAAMRWALGSGEAPPHDPVRVPTPSEEGGTVNPFFRDFYTSTALDIAGIEAHEHTAQVFHETREAREDAFREGKLPVLFCSPTMELGVDISELNVVGLRNVPPTPANYAQRSGRAGRSGQPALVFTYCAAGNSHDQYFFKRPNLMVAGAVSPPRLDLANEDLVRAHVQGIWLAESGLDLGRSLVKVLDVVGDDPSLAIQGSVQEVLQAKTPRELARARAQRVLDSIHEDLAGADWYTAGWLDEVLRQVPQEFDRACKRWRDLYSAAHKQHKVQNAIIRDASRPARDKQEADRIAREAKAQLHLLTDEGGSDAKGTMQSDFYSYRYFASEGFLPGYNFPRLPLSAYIPGRGRGKKGRDEFLSRPRFLAISEFGPRAIVYHEGSRFIIHKAILPVGSDDIVTARAKQCPACAYVHPIAEGEGPDRCEHCGGLLGDTLRQLFRLQNVATRRKDRIVSDEEERMRLGYDVCTGVRFAEHEGRPTSRTATLERDGQVLATLTYAPAATLWRINKGWARRRPEDPEGFVLDVERGYWQRNEAVQDDDDRDVLSPKTMRVIPFVEDHRNCLMLRPEGSLDDGQMASLQAALKNALQVVFQLEDSELAAEPLPSRDDRQQILLYESAEGGAGVLRQLLDRPTALREVILEALDICHFDADGTDRRKGKRAVEECEAACYDCLMSYGNQGDHLSLDRQRVRETLLAWSGATVVASPVAAGRYDHFMALMAKAESGLERQWLTMVYEGNYRLPSGAQQLIAKCQTRPDFVYESHNVVVYVDGPPHDHPDRQTRDQAQQDALEDAGYTVLRFRHTEQWAPRLAAYPRVFGTTVPTNGASAAPAGAAGAGAPGAGAAGATTGAGPGVVPPSGASPVSSSVPPTPGGAPVTSGGDPAGV